MNAPINSHLLKPIHLATLVLTSASPDLPSESLEPIDADIAREDALAHSKRTCTASEVLDTLLLSSHTKSTCGRTEFLAWLSEQAWPEEQSEVILPSDGPLELLKLFKGYRSFAVKWVPIGAGGRLDGDNAKHEIYTLVNL